MVAYGHSFQFSLISQLQGLLLIFLCGVSLVAWNLRSIDFVSFQAWELLLQNALENACLVKDE